MRSKNSERVASVSWVDPLHAAVIKNKGREIETLLYPRNNTSSAYQAKANSGQTDRNTSMLKINRMRMDTATVLSAAIARPS